VDLSIVIVNWNSGPYLLQLLDSLEHLMGEVAQVIVVDNGSTDSSESVVAGRTGVELRKLPENVGFACAANSAIRKTCSTYILLLNPDIRIIPDTVRNLWRELECRPRVGIACASLVGEQGESQESFQIRSFPTVSSVIKDALFIDECLALLRRLHPVPYRGPSEAAHEVEQPAAAFWLLRREAWSQIGGFDERFFPAWFEDVDFCKRLSSTGWKIMLFPQWQAIHRGGISLHHLDYERFIRIYYGNLLKYWKKHHKRSYPLIWLPVRLGLLARRLRAL